MPTYQMYPGGNIEVDLLKIVSIEASIKGDTIIVLSEEYPDFFSLFRGSAKDLFTYAKTQGTGFVWMNKNQFVRPDCFERVVTTKTGRVILSTKKPKARFELFPLDEFETVEERWERFRLHALGVGVELPEMVYET